MCLCTQVVKRGYEVHMSTLGDKLVPKRLNTLRAGPTRLLPGLAGADLIFQWIGLMEYIPCFSAPE